MTSSNSDQIGSLILVLTITLGIAFQTGGSGKYIIDDNVPKASNFLMPIMLGKSPTVTQFRAISSRVLEKSVKNG